MKLMTNHLPYIIQHPSSKYYNQLSTKTKILRSNIVCRKCGNVMNMISNNDSIDKLVWRCHKRQPSHNIKINIREGSIFERFQIKILLCLLLIVFIALIVSI